MVRGKLCTTKGSSQFAENFQKGYKQTSRAMPLICVRLKPEEACKGLFVLRLLLPSSSVFETFFLLSALKIPFCQQPPLETRTPAGELKKVCLHSHSPKPGSFFTAKQMPRSRGDPI